MDTEQSSCLTNILIKTTGEIISGEIIDPSKYVVINTNECIQIFKRENVSILDEGEVRFRETYQILIDKIANNNYNDIHEIINEEFLSRLSNERKYSLITLFEDVIKPDTAKTESEINEAKSLSLLIAKNIVSDSLDGLERKKLKNVLWKCAKYAQANDDKEEIFKMYVLLLENNFTVKFPNFKRLDDVCNFDTLIDNKNLDDFLIGEDNSLKQLIECRDLVLANDISKFLEKFEAISVSDISDDMSLDFDRLYKELNIVYLILKKSNFLAIKNLIKLYREYPSEKKYYNILHNILLDSSNPAVSSIADSENLKFKSVSNNLKQAVGNNDIEVVNKALIDDELDNLNVGQCIKMGNIYHTARHYNISLRIVEYLERNRTSELDNGYLISFHNLRSNTYVVLKNYEKALESFKFLNSIKSTPHIQNKIETIERSLKSASEYDNLHGNNNLPSKDKQVNSENNGSSNHIQYDLLTTIRIYFMINQNYYSVIKILGSITQFKDSPNFDALFSEFKLMWSTFEKSNPPHSKQVALIREYLSSLPDYGGILDRIPKIGIDLDDRDLDNGRKPLVLPQPKNDSLSKAKERFSKYNNYQTFLTNIGYAILSIDSPLYYQSFLDEIRDEYNRLKFNADNYKRELIPDDFKKELILFGLSFFPELKDIADVIEASAKEKEDRLSVSVFDESVSVEKVEQLHKKILNRPRYKLIAEMLSIVLNAKTDDDLDIYELAISRFREEWDYIQTPFTLDGKLYGTIITNLELIPDLADICVSMKEKKKIYDLNRKINRLCKKDVSDEYILEVLHGIDLSIIGNDKLAKLLHHLSRHNNDKLYFYLIYIFDYLLFKKKDELKENSIKYIKNFWDKIKCKYGSVERIISYYHFIDELPEIIAKSEKEGFSGLSKPSDTIPDMSVYMITSDDFRIFSYFDQVFVMETDYRGFETLIKGCCKYPRSSFSDFVIKEAWSLVRDIIRPYGGLYIGIANALNEYGAYEILQEFENGAKESLEEQLRTLFNLAPSERNVKTMIKTIVNHKGSNDLTEESQKKILEWLKWDVNNKLEKGQKFLYRDISIIFNSLELYGYNEVFEDLVNFLFSLKDMEMGPSEKAKAHLRNVLHKIKKIKSTKDSWERRQTLEEANNEYESWHEHVPSKSERNIEVKRNLDELNRQFKEGMLRDNFYIRLNDYLNGNDEISFDSVSDSAKIANVSPDEFLGKLLKHKNFESFLMKRGESMASDILEFISRNLIDNNTLVSLIENNLNAKENDDLAYIYHWMIAELSDDRGEILYHIKSGINNSTETIKEKLAKKRAEILNKPGRYYSKSQKSYKTLREKLSDFRLENGEQLSPFLRARMESSDIEHATGRQLKNIYESFAKAWLDHKQNRDYNTSMVKAVLKILFNSQDESIVSNILSSLLYDGNNTSLLERRLCIYKQRIQFIKLTIQSKEERHNELIKIIQEGHQCIEYESSEKSDIAAILWSQECFVAYDSNNQHDKALLKILFSNSREEDLDEACEFIRQLYSVISKRNTIDSISSSTEIPTAIKNISGIFQKYKPASVLTERIIRWLDELQSYPVSSENGKIRKSLEMLENVTNKVRKELTENPPGIGADIVAALCEKILVIIDAELNALKISNPSVKLSVIDYTDLGNITMSIESELIESRSVHISSVKIPEYPEVNIDKKLEPGQRLTVTQSLGKATPLDVEATIVYTIPENGDESVTVSAPIKCVPTKGLSRFSGDMTLVDDWARHYSSKEINEKRRIIKEKIEAHDTKPMRDIICLLRDDPYVKRFIHDLGSDEKAKTPVDLISICKPILETNHLMLNESLPFDFGKTLYDYYSSEKWNCWNGKDNTTAQLPSLKECKSFDEKKYENCYSGFNNMLRIERLKPLFKAMSDTSSSSPSESSDTSSSSPSESRVTPPLTLKLMPKDMTSIKQKGFGLDEGYRVYLPSVQNAIRGMEGETIVSTKAGEEPTLIPRITTAKYFNSNCVKNDNHLFIELINPHPKNANNLNGLVDNIPKGTGGTFFIVQNLWGVCDLAIQCRYKGDDGFYKLAHKNILGKISEFEDEEKNNVKIMNSEEWFKYIIKIYAM